MSAPPPAPHYLAVGTETALAFHHAPAVPTEATGIILCPPFGWDDMCSYRSRRTWAQQLAAAGHQVLRLQLPDADDGSGGPRDPDRIGAWTGTVTTAARRLRSIGGCTRVAAIGIGAGGIAACRAVGAGAPVDDLVLWGVPGRGRTLVRELRAFARLETSMLPDDGVFAGAAGSGAELAAGGYVLSAETLTALEALDLAEELGPATAAEVRVLLLDRDGVPVDPHLQGALSAAGARVTLAPGPGYAELMAEPAYTRPPTELMPSLLRWLGAGSAPSRREAARVTVRETLELPAGGRATRELPLAVEQPFGRLFGVLTEPRGDRAPLCAVALNAGALNHTGPNRMWVEAARRWAGLGVPTLRLDVEGIGDADGDGDQWSDVGSFYVPQLVTQVRAALDVLEARGLPARFVLLGLCSGAYWSFHAALQDDRVAAALMLNPRTLFWDEWQHTVRESRKLRRALRPSAWRRVSPDRARELARAAAARVVHAPRTVLPGRTADRGSSARLDDAFDRLRDRGARGTLLFTGDEPLYEDFAREGRLSALPRWPNLDVQLLVRSPETHTLRPPPIQRLAHGALDRALERELRLTS